MRVLLLVSTCGALALLAGGLWLASFAPGRVADPPAEASEPAIVEPAATALQPGIDEAARAERAENERQAILALRKFALAQERHRQAHGVYAPEVTALDLPAEMTAATFRRSEAYHGYQFVLAARSGAARIDPATEFAVIALPQVYGATGARSFAIRPDGTVLAKDTHGRPVHDAAALAHGWVQP